MATTGIGYCKCGRSKASKEAGAIIWWTRPKHYSRAYTPTQKFMRRLGPGPTECPWCHDTLWPDATATPAQKELQVGSE